MEMFWSNMKSIRRSKVILAIFELIIGIILLVRPIDSLMAVVRLIGALLIVIGAFLILLFLAGEKAAAYKAGMVFGIILAAVGVGMEIHPDALVALIPTLIGILILISGLTNLFETFQLIGQTGARWGISLALAIVTILFGVLIFTKPFGLAGVVTSLVGIAIIYDAATNLWILSRLSKDKRATVSGKEIIDVDAVVIGEETSGHGSGAK